jgi:hypothetical protein
MPIRLNYTKRKKLLASEVAITVLANGDGPASFDAELGLDALRVSSPEAKVFVEAYQGQSRRMRFSFGTVANMVIPEPGSRRLVDFDSWEQVLFRVKVTDPSGRLVAWRNKIRPRALGMSRDNDLVLFENADLGGRLWTIRFDDDLGPIVQIDRAAGDRYSIGEDGKFIATAYPEILRRTLFRAFVEEAEDGEDEDHWSHQWLHGFLVPALGLAEPPALSPDPRARHSWIENAVDVFARHNQLSDLWKRQSAEDKV